jgi:hypothetical protein
VPGSGIPTEGSEYHSIRQEASRHTQQCFRLIANNNIMTLESGIFTRQRSAHQDVCRYLPFNDTLIAQLTTAPNLSTFGCLCPSIDSTIAAGLAASIALLLAHPPLPLKHLELSFEFIRAPAGSRYQQSCDDIIRHLIQVPSMSAIEQGDCLQSLSLVPTVGGESFTQATLDQLIVSMYWLRRLDIWMDDRSTIDGSHLTRLTRLTSLKIQPSFSFAHPKKIENGESEPRWAFAALQVVNCILIKAPLVISSSRMKEFHMINLSTNQLHEILTNMPLLEVLSPPYYDNVVGS